MGMAYHVPIPTAGGCLLPAGHGLIRCRLSAVSDRLHMTMLRFPLSRPLWRSFWLLLAGLLLSLTAQAQFRVEITGAGISQYPITLSPFRGETAAPQQPSAIILADLLRSGVFKSVPVNSEQLDAASRPALAPFRAAGSDYLVAGNLQRQGAGWQLQVRLWDVVEQRDMGSQSYAVAPADLRLAAHRAADWIYQQITGRQGVFSSRLSYVTRAGGRHTLWVSDADGEGAQPALASNHPIISPSWSPDGSRLAYVSFELGKPVVFVHNVRTGQRQQVANFKGSNSAPAWSPDGNQLLVTLTRDGGSHLYLIPATGGQPRQLTSGSSINTEARFSPDGRSIYFVSDRGGAPQIYRMSAGGGEPQRVTWQGGYNISPTLSADGQLLAYITRSGGFKLAVMDLRDGSVQLVTDTVHDERPSFAPNGRMLVYATRIGGQKTLMTTTVDGSIKTRLAGRQGELREPAWAPLQ